MGTIKLARRGQVLEATLEHPGKANAIDRAMLAKLDELVERVQADSGTVGARISRNRSRRPCASSASAAEAAGAMASKMPSSACEKPWASPAISSG